MSTRIVRIFKRMCGAALIAALLGSCGGGAAGEQQGAVRPDATLSLVAGSIDTSGNVDGTGTAARFGYTTGVALGSAGNLIVVDLGNNTIRKISPDGVVSTLAGSPGVRGWTDGTGPAATFYFPYDVAVDAEGNAYVTNIGDTAFGRGPFPVDPGVALSKNFRKVSPAGVVTTLPEGQTARGVALDKQGNIYIAVAAAIKKITPGGSISTLAGIENAQGSVDGTGPNARFFGLEALTVDDAGNLFVSDAETVRKVTPAGTVTTLAGRLGQVGSNDGTGPNARFGRLSGIAVDKDGNVLVADSHNYTIRKITPAGVVTTIAGKAGVKGVVLGNLPGGLDEVQGLALDASGTLFVLTQNAVLKIQ